MLLNSGAAGDSWESLEQQRDQTVNLKGSQLWILIGRTDAKADAPVFWSPYVSNRLIGKVPDVGKDWGQKEKRVSEVEMTGWHHWCNGHELGQILGDGGGQGGLGCCSPQGRKESDTTEQLNSDNNKNNCFTMLCQFLLYNRVSQLYAHNPFPLEPRSHSPPSHPSRPSQSPELSSRCYTTASH